MTRWYSVLVDDPSGAMRVIATFTEEYAAQAYIDGMTKEQHADQRGDGYAITSYQLLNVADLGIWPRTADTKGPAK